VAVCYFLTLIYTTKTYTKHSHQPQCQFTRIYTPFISQIQHIHSHKMSATTIIYVNEIQSIIYKQELEFSPLYSLPSSNSVCWWTRSWSTKAKYSKPGGQLGGACGAAIHCATNTLELQLLSLFYLNFHCRLKIGIVKIRIIKDMHCTYQDCWILIEYNNMIIKYVICDNVLYFSGWGEKGDGCTIQWLIKLMTKQ